MFTSWSFYNILKQSGWTDGTLSAQEYLPRELPRRRIMFLKTEELRKKPGGTEEGRDTNKWSCGWGLVSYCCFCCAAQRWKACCKRARLVAPCFQLQSLFESMLDNDLYTLLKIYNWKYMRPNTFKSVRFRQSALCLAPLLNMGHFILGYTLTSHFNRYTCSTANANI